MEWQIIGGISAALAIIGSLITWFCRRGLPAVRKINHFIDDMTGEEARPGVKARPGILERLDNIEHELHPNSGGSMRDAIDLQGTKLNAHIAACKGESHGPDVP